MSAEVLRACRECGHLTHIGRCHAGVDRENRCRCMSDATAKAFALVLRHREENGDVHLHHRDCIHNLPPEEQIRVRGKTVEWWMTMVGRMPKQITPDQWECEPPLERPTQKERPL